jgi:hypothetical protein
MKIDSIMYTLMDLALVPGQRLSRLELSMDIVGAIQLDDNRCFEIHPIFVED